MLPIALPAVFYGAEVTRYFNRLLPAGEEVFVQRLESIATLAVAAALPPAIAGVPRDRGALSGGRRLGPSETRALSLLAAAAAPFVSSVVHLRGWQDAARAQVRSPDRRGAR